MPKLDDTHLIGRLTKRIAELEAGEDVAARDIAAVLSADQRLALEGAWTAQQGLRLSKSARTKDAQRALGWKSKREVHIEALKLALAEAKREVRKSWDAKRDGLKVRQGKTYFEALKAAELAGKDKQAAKNWANNELTRAGLPRMDGGTVRRQNSRSAEMTRMEQQLRERQEGDLTSTSEAERASDPAPNPVRKAKSEAK